MKHRWYSGNFIFRDFLVRSKWQASRFQKITANSKHISRWWHGYILDATVLDVCYDFVASKWKTRETGGATPDTMYLVYITHVWFYKKGGVLRFKKSYYSRLTHLRLDNSFDLLEHFFSFRFDFCFNGRPL